MGYDHEIITTGSDETINYTTSSSDDETEYFLCVDDDATNASEQQVYMYLEYALELLGMTQLEFMDLYDSTH